MHTFWEIEPVNPLDKPCINLTLLYSTLPDNHVRPYYSSATFIIIINVTYLVLSSRSVIHWALEGTSMETRIQVFLPYII